MLLQFNLFIKRVARALAQRPTQQPINNDIVKKVLNPAHLGKI